MSNYNYAQGAIHIDHHKDLNIDVKNVDDAIRLMSAFMYDRAEDITPDSSSSVSPESNSENTSSIAPECYSDIPLFRFIHPSVTDEAERIQIHREVVNLVTHLPLPEVCRYLQQMKHDNRVFLCSKPETMFEELHRLGLPPESTPGFSKKNFMNYYNINN